MHLPNVCVGNNNYSGISFRILYLNSAELSVKRQAHARV